jgi:hypothetical protein
MMWDADSQIRHFETTENSWVGQDSSVGIATRYGLDGPGIESRWGGGARFPPSVQIGPRAHPASYPMGTGSFQGGKAAEAWR